MAKFDFSTLYSRYPAAIDKMPKVFNSQQFILELARQNPTIYVSALYVYREAEHQGVIAPFQVLHRILAAKLKDFPEIIELVRTDAVGQDILGQPAPCTEWRRLK